MAVSWLLMAVVEWAAWRSGGASRTVTPSPPLPLEPVSAVDEPAPHVRVLARPEPEPAPEPLRGPVEAVAVEPEPEVVPPEAEAAEPESGPDPVPVEPVAVEPEPEPVSVDPVAVEPEPPRSWNLWELERLARARSGANPVHDEELSFLLVYLRDFAGTDGVLPIDFDALVRESFGDLLATPTGA